MNAEEVRVGPYQVLTLLLLAVNFIVVAMSHALSIFYKYTPKFYCQTDGSTNRTYGCGSVPCSQYVFESAGAEQSVAMEWQLVCEREPLLRSASDVYFAGMLIGGCLAGLLADRIGRLPVMAICLYAQGTMAVALNVVQEYKLFLVFRGLQGFFIQGLESCTFVLCMELFPAKFRTLIALIILSMRSCGLALLSGLSYAIPDWRILQLVVSVPTAATVLYIWLIPESPRWLLAMSKSTEAEILLDRIANYNSLCGPKRREDSPTAREKPQKPKRKARANEHPADVEKSSAGEAENLLLGSREAESSFASRAADSDDRNPEQPPNSPVDEKTELPAELDIEEIAKASLMVVADEKSGAHDKNAPPSFLLVSREALAIDDNSKRNARGGCLGFLESRLVGRTCGVVVCLWFTSSIAFHALVSLPNRLSTQRHVSLTLAAGMELVSFVLVFLLVSSRCCSRRWALCASQFVVGACCLTIAVFACVYPHPAGLGWLAKTKTAVVVVGRVANIGSFFILRLLVVELFPTISRGTGVGLCIAAEMIGGLLTPLILMLNIYVSELARFLVGSLCIVMGLLTLMLPETSRKVLPDSVEEARSLGQKGSSKNPEVLREKLFSEDWVDAGNVNEA